MAAQASDNGPSDGGFTYGENREKKGDTITVGETFERPGGRSQALDLSDAQSVKYTSTTQAAAIRGQRHGRDHGRRKRDG